MALMVMRPRYIEDGWRKVGEVLADSVGLGRQHCRIVQAGETTGSYYRSGDGGTTFTCVVSYAVIWGYTEEEGEGGGR